MTCPGHTSTLAAVTCEECTADAQAELDLYREANSVTIPELVAVLTAVFLFVLLVSP